jgi:hypothetical protein
METSAMLSHSEQTMDDLLTDPLTLSLMRADGVDPMALRSDLVHVAQRLGERPAAMLPAEWRKREPDWKRLLADCIQASRAKSGPAHRSFR